MRNRVDEIEKKKNKKNKANDENNENNMNGGIQNGVTKYKSILVWMSVSLLILIIFLLSSQNANDSTRLSKWVLEWIIKHTSLKNVIQMTQTNIRNFAHFFEYMVLGVLVFAGFRLVGLRRRYVFLFTILFCILVSVADEIFQSFISGRATELEDLIKDNLGSFSGCFLSLLGSGVKALITKK